MALLDALLHEWRWVMKGGSVDRVDRELLASLYENLILSQLAVIPVSLVLAFYHQGAAGSDFVWLAYVIIVAVTRLVIGLRYKEWARDDHNNGHLLWWRLFYLGVVLGGLGWGAAGIIFFAPGQIDHQILLIGVIAGITAGSVPALSGSFLASVIFLLLSVSPLSVNYLRMGDAEQGMGLLMIFYLAMLFAISYRSHLALRHEIRLRHENERLFSEMRQHTEELEEQRARSEAEQEMALSVFSSIMPLEKLHLPNIAMHLSSHSAFNGDILLIEQRPDGTQNILLGDFTGHGLAASLGAIPVADIFRSMSQKGFSIEAIVSEINSKIHIQLPENLFMASCIAELDGTRSRLRIWNAGLPSVYVLNGHDGAIKRRVESLSPPLGIVGSETLNERPLVLKLGDKDQLFMATDGVIEQRNQAGEQFGEARLEAVLNTANGIDDVAETLQQELLDFCEGAAQGDDVTFVVARTEKQALQEAASSAGKAEAMPSHWDLTVTLSADALRNFNPVPVLSHLIKEFNGHNPAIEHADLVIGELYKNALDHGVLCLDSTMKQTPDGYVEYYALRDRLLADIEEGQVAIQLVNAAEGEGGRISVSVTDTGAGFDHVQVVMQGEGVSDDATHGRGLVLVKSLCETVEFYGSGNRVRADYRW